jgi:hypothetical protein
MARGDLDAIAGEAKQLLESKVLNAAWETMEREVLSELERLGTVKTADQQKELNQLVYHFQSIRDAKRKLNLTIQGAQLRKVNNE